MSHADLTVYRTRLPGVLQLWQHLAHADDAWNTEVKAALSELDMAGRKVIVDEYTGAIIGVEHDGGDPPAGWRVHRKLGHLVPNRSITAGKRIDQVLDRLRRPDVRDRLPGMPRQHWGGPALLTCGVAVHEDEHGPALYATWPGSIPDELVDGEIWERLRLSVYYAVLEAEEDAKAGAVS
ncbi:hypothetical protein DQ384_26220 [Sphaerisporangium album]|uniref:Uncharacterized protein n=1 Tax=Sphaerisporangium album TaxID=509200 RepID=A0A367FA23_9ACTN|nr:hypothetical protein [Sphaerisporangium album]RCG27218.1 hypothetical protein DQ384_26220 [Sphaerisporangium album]